MLNLQLRDEFLGSQMPGTAITLRRSDNTGAAQQDPKRILDITYPTTDVQMALVALGDKRPARPIVLMGDRGRGKSHIMAVMHHAVASAGTVEDWARSWGQSRGLDSLANLSLQRGFIAISEAVHNQEYPYLWDLLFDRHPEGQLYKGKFLQLASPYPPRSLLEEMFAAQPVALILDEFQRWFDGLHDEIGPTGRKWREAASAFIQVLSELSRERPDILILAISVLNNNTEAFRQVHRDTPMVINFLGRNARQDRQRLLLHRLFKNRGNIPVDKIRQVVAAYGAERFRLLFPHKSDSERDQVMGEVAECWPFSPELLDLLQDQILMAQAAQETRDLIRILASAYRARGEQVPLITAADFFVDDDASGVQSLLDSIATAVDQVALREVAQRNLDGLRNMGISLAHDRELVTALWMHSMSPLRNVGATRRELQLAVTRDAPLDNNAFQSELTLLVENSVNIHGEESADGRLRFGPEENPRSKVKATARNPRLWQAPAEAGQKTYPGQDLKHIRATLRHLLTPQNKETTARIVVLGPNWEEDPWPELEEPDRPERWDRPVLLVLPAPREIMEGGQVKGLGEWLAKRVPSRRNTVRFLLPAQGTTDIYRDQALVFSARCSYLTSIEWKDDPRYSGLKAEFDKPLRDELKKRFDRFALLRKWDFQNPEKCVFEVEKIDAQGDVVPGVVESRIAKDLFDLGDFEAKVLEYAKGSKTVGDLLKDLIEPPPPTVSAIPYLGDRAIYEAVLRLVARGKVMVNVDGAWHGRLAEHADEDQAYQYVSSKAFKSGPEMRLVHLGLPGSAGGSTVSGKSAQSQTGTPPNGKGGASPKTDIQYPHEEDTTPPDTEVKKEPGAVGHTPAAPQVKVLQTPAPASGINLSGYFEGWGVPADTMLSVARIEFTGLSVQQVKQVLQRLPSSLQATLEISYQEKAGE